jgi:squalene synthase HpnC
MSPVIADLPNYGPAAPPAEIPSLAQAEAYCRELALRHYENFTVVSRLFPAHLRQPLANVYAWCRWADDLGDETGDPDLSRELLAWWQDELEKVGSLQQRHPVLIALAPTMREFGLPKEPFRDLISAFQQDQRQTRYDTKTALLDYCRRSANPVGRLVLQIGRSFDEEAAGLSDAICTGLQLVNFWQDVARDAARGRIYLPGESLARHALSFDDVVTGQPRAALCELLRDEVGEAERLLQSGAPLAARVHRDLRLPVTLFREGGLAIASAIRRQGYDVWRQRPTVSRWTKLRLLAGAWWRGAISDRP